MISISSCFNYDLTLEEQLKSVKSTGFNGISISGRYSYNGLLDNTDHLISTIQSSGIGVDTIHGCRTDDENALGILEKCSFVANQLNAPIIVVHPCEFQISYNQIKSKYDTLMSISKELKLMAKEYNVKFALENLHPDGATSLVKMALDELDPEYFGLCYDITHAQVDGPRDCLLLKEYGHRIIAVHISDRKKAFVDHLVPGEGFIDFDPLLNVLGEINYKGSLLMEVLANHTQYKNPDILLKKTYEAALDMEKRLLDYKHKIVKL